VDTRDIGTHNAPNFRQDHSVPSTHSPPSNDSKRYLQRQINDLHMICEACQGRHGYLIIPQPGKSSKHDRVNNNDTSTPTSSVPKGALLPSIDSQRTILISRVAHIHFLDGIPVYRPERRIRRRGVPRRTGFVTVRVHRVDRIIQEFAFEIARVCYP
jgi:hypothetical protein